MKGCSKLLTLLAMIVAISTPVLAYGPWFGDGSRNRDCPRFDKEERNTMCPNFDLQNKNLTEEQRTQLKKLNDEWSKDISSSRKALWQKRQEMISVLNSANPDEAKLWDLQKQTSKLRDQLDQEWIKHQLGVKRIIPDAKIGQAERGRHGFWKFW